MKLEVIAIGKRMPGWVETGVKEYAKRLPAHWKFQIRELAAATAGDVQGRMSREADALLAAADRRHVVALDETGRLHDTAAVSMRLEHWQGLGRDIAVLIGGADGLHADVHTRADEVWSLSPLTFPHPLVRVILVEQLYRAQSLLAGHPYHRA